MDLTTQTPVEIDTAIAEIYGRFYKASHDADVAFAHAKSYRKGLEAKAAGRSGYLYWTEERLAEQEEKVATLRAAAQEIMRETAPFNQEFDRRGGWTRAWLVDNTNGHVHNTMDCQTCFITTQFVWLPEFSGQPETDIVEAAGEKACTVCYPSAPVDVLKRKSSIEAPARKAARLEREARSAEIAAKKAAKAIASPDGSEISVYDWTTPARDYRERDGSTRHVPAYERREIITTLAAAKKWLTDSQETGPYNHKRPEDVLVVAEAIAHKLGTSVDEEIEAAKKRAAKRR